MNQLAFFSVGSQWKWLNTSGNAYLATILSINFFCGTCRGKTGFEGRGVPMQWDPV